MKKLKNCDVYVGTIKKCDDFYNYEKYGEKKEYYELIVGSIRFGEVRQYVTKVDEQAILIKVNDDQYVWIKSLTNFVDEVLVDLGIAINTIKTFPTEDDELFVDRSTLVPYFENFRDQKLKVKKLKREVLLDPRIKCGIEN